MKALIASLVIGMLPLAALAQTPAAKPAAKATAKPAAKPVAKPAAKPATASNKLSPSAQKALEEATPLEEPDPTIKLTEADIEVAKKVYVGEIPCELGATVKVTPLKREGFFLIQVGRNRFRMHPVESRTGAIRLEDPVRGAMWLQLGNKSMLMSQKLGQRLADECQSPAQVTYAEMLKTRPAFNLLEPAPAVPAIPAEALPPGTPAVPSAPAASQPVAAQQPPVASPTAQPLPVPLVLPPALPVPAAPALPQAATPAAPASSAPRTTTQ